MNNFKPGQFIKFTYALPELNTTEPKEIFVLNPNYQNKLHGLDVSLLPVADREILQIIMDPTSKGKHHPIPLVNDVLHRMDPVISIKNPLAFYAQFVRPFMHGRDIYRTYWINHVSNVVVEKTPGTMGDNLTPDNARPLFHPPGQEENTTRQMPKPLFHKVEGPAPVQNTLNQKRPTTVRPKVVRPKKNK